MLSGNEEYIKSLTPSYDYENDSLNTYFSNENYYPFIYVSPYIYISENYEYPIFNPNNSNSIITGNISDFKPLEYPTLSIEKPNKFPKFSVLSKPGRGKKPENVYPVKRHRHLNTHFDNLQIKIQVNYINFIINYQMMFYF